MPRVIIVQRRLTHYRVPLFAALRGTLAGQGLDLDLLVGDGTHAEAAKHDEGDLPWAKRLRTRYLFGDRLCWQPFGHYLRGADLVIITQENRLLYNHWLLARRQAPRLAFWGHGANLQSRNQGGISERYKRWTAKHVDWWFAYTELSAQLVIASGFPSSRISVLNNAIDTELLLEQCAAVTARESESLRVALGLGSGPIGLYVGSLYREKRLGFLFAAAEKIKREVPEFRLLIVGEGPERDKVRQWCAHNSWSRWVGAAVGSEKAAYLSIASVLLNPGLVGLNVLDAFAGGVPMLTTDCGIHSPEIVYLEHRRNGLVSENNVDGFANACVMLLHSDEQLKMMRQACKESALKYTLKAMVGRFAGGIMQALSVP